MQILFSKTSIKYLARCEGKTRTAIIEAIGNLPDHGDIRKLKGRIIENAYRLRVGKFRVVYTREGDTIRIIKVDTRGDIYK